MTEWDQGISGLCNGVGKSGNGTSRVWLYSKVTCNSGIHSDKDNSSVVIWLAHVIVVTKVRIQTSE